MTSPLRLAVRRGDPGLHRAVVRACFGAAPASHRCRPFPAAMGAETHEGGNPQTGDSDTARPAGKKSCNAASEKP